MFFEILSFPMHFLCSAKLATETLLKNLPWKIIKTAYFAAVVVHDVSAVYAANSAAILVHDVIAIQVPDFATILIHDVIRAV